MEKIIRYRAKRKDNNEWIFGLLVKRENNMYMITEENSKNIKFNEKSGLAEINIIEVIPETAGEYVEIVDAYEGDMIFTRECSGYPKELQWYAQIKFNKKMGRLMILDDLDDWYEIDDFIFDKIVGNIHDNPELLEIKSY